MLSRRLRYHANYWTDVFFLPAARLIEWVLRTDVAESVDGIGLVNMSLNAQPDADFLPATQDALALIRRTDPRRYRILVREFRYIVNTALHDTVASYDRRLRTCYVDFSRFRLGKDPPHYEWSLAFYAAALVHEATHGRLHSLCIPYNSTTQVRVERLCCTEERRFVRRIESDTYDFSTLLPPFDEAEWLSRRKQGWIRKLKDLVQRVSESNQQARRRDSGSR